MCRKMSGPFLAIVVRGQWHVITAAVESRRLFFLACVTLLLVILRMIACCFER